MLDIIIAFIVIGMVIANIMKHMGGSGQWPKSDTPGTPGAPGNPGRFGNSPSRSNDGRNIYRKVDNQQVHMSGAGRGGMLSASQDSIVGEDAATSEGYSIGYEGSSSLEGSVEEGLKNKPYDGSGAVKLEIISTDVKAHSLSFSHHAIINGIIMSELLQPPKALRRRRTY